MARVLRSHCILASLSLLMLHAPPSVLAYQADNSLRWSETANNPSTGGLGTPITLTWGLVDDGVTISGNEGSSGSDLMAFMATNIDSDPNVYLQIFEDSFGRIAELAGVTYVYEPNNTSQSINNTAFPFGTVGVRPDIRIGGHSIDGQTGTNTLAYNYFPDHGDMVIDTDNVNSYSNSNNNYRLFRNVVMHETMHGLGFSHVESNNSAFLMEPSINTSFDGPQLDDIRGLQRLYGDPLEKNGGNNTSGNATPLGTVTDLTGVQIGQFGDSKSVSSSQSDFVSIDDNSDVDFYSFTIDSELEVTLDLIPRGTQYNEGPQGGSQSMTDSKAISDLTLTLFDTNGSSVITTSNSGGLGVTESIVETLSAGTYFARVTGTANDIQLYGLDVSASFFSGQSIVWTGAIDNDWDVNSTTNWDNSGPTVFSDTDLVTFSDGALNAVANQTTVSLSATNVVPSGVTFTNLNDTFTINGSSGIQGSAGVMVNGGGTVVLANGQNSYSGSTDVTNSSTLIIRNIQTGLDGDFNIGTGSTIQIGDGLAAGNMAGLATINIAAGATLDVVDDDGMIDMDLKGAGNIELRESSTIANNMSGFTGEITQHAGTLTFDATASDTFSSDSTVNLDGGSLRVFPAGDVRVLEANVNVISGVGPNIRIGNAGASELIINGDVNVSLADAHFTADGDAALTIDGNMTLGNGVDLELSTGGTGDDGITINGVISGTGGFTKTLNGELRLNAANSYTGNTTIAAGKLVLGQFATILFSQHIEVQQGATIDATASSSGLVFFSGQTVDLAGTIDGDVIAVVGSTVRVSELDASILNGDYTQNPGATLALDLFDPNTFDVLNVSGNLQAGGTLQVTNAGAFSIAAGDSFDILDFALASGAFDAIELPDLVAGLDWDVSTLLTTGEISVIGLAGDFDGDLDVDSQDFLVWQRTDGSAEGLAAWEANYGASSLGEQVTVVPEPSTGFLFSLLVICWPCRRWQRWA